MGTIDRFRGHPLRILGRTGSTVIVTVPVRLDRRGLRPGASPPPPYSHLDQRPAPAHDLATAGEHRAPAPASGGGGWGVRVRATVRRGGRRIHRDAYVRTHATVDACVGSTGAAPTGTAKYVRCTSTVSSPCSCLDAPPTCPASQKVLTPYDLSYET
jgi:hypothetical protein